jgi:formylglycine-generating enzyme required for sulfatase activity
MEYIPGPDLREALTAQQSPFAVEDVLRLADQLLDVLEYLHTQPEPVIHRDIKPANIKVPNGQVKLLDFGLTKGSADYVSRIRMSSLTGYTLTFAPPEQIRGKPTGPRSDLFALASTLYCLLTGVDPPDALERVFALQEGDPDLLQPATTLNAQVPQAVNDILLQAMALRYEPRPASAAAMRKALREAAPALWQSAPWSGQSVHNPASNQGAQGIFYGPVYFGQPVADEQEAARKRAEEEAEQQRQREQEAARKRAEEEERQRREQEAARKRAEAEARQPQPQQNEQQLELVRLLNDATQHLPLEKRLEAGRTLARLGDPRYPVSLDEWRTQTAQRNETFGAPDGYWCYVRPGTYRIGGWKEGEASADHELPAFWIARYPITVAQYAAFIADGGYANKDYWTPNGWEWRQERDRTQPYRWDNASYNSPNQAVIGVTWYECMAFCSWLTARLTDRLPAGYAVQLPTEAEWEAAAAYDAQMQRRTYPWDNKTEPTPEHAIFADDQGNRLGAPAPVGVCPTGAAACGALDMGGQVWEWCRSSHGAYPAGANEGEQEFNRDEGDVPVRGGSYRNSSYVRCAARGRHFPGGRDDDGNFGLRVLLSPRVPSP